jgi:cytosine/adenosine deaminase-related metal-dependent hydrolase
VEIESALSHSTRPLGRTRTQYAILQRSLAKLAKANAKKLDKMGVLAAGKEADFLVLDANPLDDITNTSRICRIYLKGAEIDRASLRPN